MIKAKPTQLLRRLMAPAAAVLAVLAMPATAFAATGDAGDRSLGTLPGWFWVAPVGAVLALVFAYIFYKMMRSAKQGNERMEEIAQHVRDGAYAYLKQQYKVVALFFVVVCVLLAVQAFVLEAQSRLVPFAFLTGGLFSGLAGFFGMVTATNASSRTTQGASESLDRGLKVAFRSGAVMGLTVVGLALIDIVIWFGALYMYGMSLESITVTMLCFGMGASAQALFARVGGGIYTKAADVGADLVGKVEQGIPEDDPRNPATIADNVGDNVGDVAGMGADLYESYAGSILATAALGVAAATAAGAVGEKLNLLLAPMGMAGIGILISIISIFFVRTKEGASQMQLLWALRIGVYGASVLILAAGIPFLLYALPGHLPGVDAALPLNWGIVCAVVVGLIAGCVIGYFTEYYTSQAYKPTQGVSAQSEFGPATVIIAGVAEGMMSTWVSIATVAVGMVAAYGLAGGFALPALGLYGVGFAAVGMLSTLGITLATDAYGPIADNAGGNAEMSGLGEEVRAKTDQLDTLGNTTAATGKGFAIGSAALTALALLAAYVEEVRIGQERQFEAVLEEQAVGEWTTTEVGGPNAHFRAAIKTGEDKRDVISFLVLRGETSDPQLGAWLTAQGWSAPSFPDAGIEGLQDAGFKPLTPIDWDPDGDGPMALKVVRPAQISHFMTYYNVTLMNPKVLAGMFMGVLGVFVFCAMTMKAVGRAAGAMVEEVRRQFKEMPGIITGDTTPDYALCVEISTKGAQKEMILPSMVALLLPVAVGLVLGVAGVMGMLGGALVSGFAVAIFMANAGGSWDNAKKYIEEGHFGGKGSPAHDAGVIGDTVGDPFKDTSGPSLNILIKLISMVSVVFAGVVAKLGSGGIFNIG